MDDAELLCDVGLCGCEECQDGRWRPPLNMATFAQVEQAVEAVVPRARRTERLRRDALRLRQLFDRLATAEVGGFLADFGLVEAAANGGQGALLTLRLAGDSFRRRERKELES
jgi:hypothetical protein